MKNTPSKHLKMFSELKFKLNILLLTRNIFPILKVKPTLSLIKHLILTRINKLNHFIYQNEKNMYTILYYYLLSNMKRCDFSIQQIENPNDLVLLKI